MKRPIDIEDHLKREIQRLQDAKRRALALADERAKEANELKAELMNAWKALGTALVAMRNASELSAEYDFGHAIATVEAVLADD